MKQHLLQAVGGILIALTLAFIVGVMLYARNDAGQGSHPTQNGFNLPQPYRVLSVSQGQGYLNIAVLVPDSTTPQEDAQVLQQAANGLNEPVAVSYCSVSAKLGTDVVMCSATLWFNVPNLPVTGISS